MGHFDHDSNRYVTGTPEETKQPFDRFRAGRQEAAKWIAEGTERPPSMLPPSSFRAGPGLDRDGRDELKEAAHKYLELGGEVSPEAFGMFRKAVADDTKTNVELGGHDPDDLSLPARTVNDLGEDLDDMGEQVEHERWFEAVSQDIDVWIEQEFGSFDAAVEWLGDQPDPNAARDQLLTDYCEATGLDPDTGYPAGDNAAAFGPGLPGGALDDAAFAADDSGDYDRSAFTPPEYADTGDDGGYADTGDDGGYAPGVVAAAEQAGPLPGGD
jgi:hypothetical protein